MKLKKHTINDEPNYENQKMSKIDDVQKKVQNYFTYKSGPSYVRILDTPNVWGMPFSEKIMPHALARQAEFERAIEEIIQKSRYRCDISSLNSPDPDWGRIILGALDTALSRTMGRTAATQFRFLFGQTPVYPISEPPNYTDFKAALVRLVRTRSKFWEIKPEILMGRFYRIEEGVISSLKSKLLGDSIISSDDTKMTWNHTKIIAVDGAEALVGGHNLNMDLFRSYPPVHDVSVVVHGEAAYGAQLFLNNMWECGKDLLKIEKLSIDELLWKTDPNTPIDPLSKPGAANYMQNSQENIILMHQTGGQTGGDASIEESNSKLEVPDNQDLRTLIDIQQDLFQERILYSTYDHFQDYRLATCMLSVGKYWTGPNQETDYKNASELMKEQLIKNAKNKIRMSQMDLISGWKKNWSDHVVCHWIIEALLANKNLQVQVVVSPLDAGAGAEGDQYSFGSGASRTFDLIKYYMTHDIDTDNLLDDADNVRVEALNRLQVAPLYYTDLVPEDQMTEGVTYKWPNLTKDGYTATLKQKPLNEVPPNKGVIGSAAMSAIKASGLVYNKVKSAPGNHAKIMIVDDELYVVGSDNLYPGTLSEFNFLIEGKEAVNELLKSYWEPLWRYSGPHSVLHHSIAHRLACGNYFSVLVRQDGSLVAWGDNCCGPCNVPTGNAFVGVAAGNYYCVALKQDGSLVAWGDNRYGQCNVPLGGDFVEAVGQFGNFIALKKDGSIVSCGNGATGDSNLPWSDNGCIASNIPPGKNFVGISAGNLYCIALTVDGSIVVWGNDDKVKGKVPSGSNFKAVAGGRYHCIILTKDGALMAWGHNGYGQCNVPNGNNFVAIAAGTFHSIALKADGSLVAWGRNDFDQCNVPSGKNFVAIASHGNHSIAIKEDGIIIAWGLNDHGQCNTPNDLSLQNATLKINPVDRNNGKFEAKLTINQRRI